ncbi:MAG TPA: hypothetical protein VJP02_20055 [Candidatus Sulfotelmatobacter sp.]|nr:hypothetical protein [Candidatus Sulfotelmatobacter sp.]
MSTIKHGLLQIALVMVVFAASAGTTLAQRNALWLGGSGNWFGPSDACVSWNVCSGPGTNPGESGFTDNVFINTPNSTVTLAGGARIANLTLASSDTLTVIGTGYVEFDGSSASTLNNAGTINLTGTTGITFVGIPSPNILTLTIAGGGTINMQNAFAHIAGSGANLINQETIQGQGFILASGFITNQGTINANISGTTLLVQPGANGLTNSGVLEASNGGTLNIVSGFSNILFDNTGGTIQALNGSTVLNQAGIIMGGTLTTSGTGIIQTVGSNPTLENLTNAGTYQILPGGDTTLVGAIHNTGSFLIGSTTGGSQIIINGPVTLSGGGSVTMVDSANPFNTITSFTPGSQLTNQQIIRGTGAIGDADLTILNQGTILANVAAHPLGLFDAGFTNQGTVKAGNGATLNIFSSTFNNQGTLQVNTFSTVNFSGNSDLTNYDSTTNTLTGGTYLLGGTLQFTNAAHGIVAIDTNAANIILDGPSSQILDAFNKDALAGLATNASGGSFTIENGRNFTTAGDFQNFGNLSVGFGGSSTFTTGSGGANNYTQNGASSLTHIQSFGQLTTSTYTQNGGSTQIDPFGTLTATNLIWNDGAITVNGTLDPLSLTVCPSCSLSGTGSIMANVTSNGTVTPGASPSLSVTGNYAQGLTGTLLIDLAGTGSGQYGVLDVSGNALLGGTLDFTVVNGFTPDAGDNFTFLLFGGESGNFSNVVFTNWNCPVGDTCSEVFGAGMLSLDISGSTQPTPEPPALLQLAGGFILLMIGQCLKRRKKAARAR